MSIYDKQCKDQLPELQDDGMSISDYSDKPKNKLDRLKRLLRVGDDGPSSEDGIHRFINQMPIKIKPLTPLQVELIRKTTEISMTPPLGHRYIVYTTIFS